ncbi:MAG: peptidylprolyl isomerase [Myxococcota bacterium]|nr:peptidylprolyl isomerase [Myxococcota bacterium]
MKGLVFSLLLVFPQLGLATSKVQPPGSVKVQIDTSMGDIVVQLDSRASITIKNFLSYVDSGYYDGTIFHRVISNFMIQGGGMVPGLQEKKPQAPIQLEVGKGLSNVRGSVAMARTNAPHSATSQFFINVKDNKRLDTAGGGYAVFGKVVQGMDVVDKIKAVETTVRMGQRDVPVKPVMIKAVKRLP